MLINIYNEVLQKASILEVLNYYGIDVHRNKAICPFHNDTNPSFVVNTKKNIATCFSCQTTGNVISIVQKLEKQLNNNDISTSEAITKVVEICNLNIDVSRLKKVRNNYKYKTFSKTYSEEEQNLLKTTELLNKIFTYNLKAINKDARQYLKERGISEKVIDDLSFGFIPNGQLLNIMDKREEISSSSLLKLGLLRIDDKGNYQEVFHDRISIPIRDEKGNIVSFCGRTIKDETPKYLHTVETDIFHKKELLYNFDNAKILSYNNELILVEGYMDVAVAKKLGMENVVALMGVALTEEQLKQIQNNNSTITFALDNDNAGRESMLKNIPELLNKNIKVSVIDISKLGDYKDFGDLSNTELTFLDVQNVKVSGFHFLLEYQYFKDIPLSVENIYYTYQQLKRDGLIKNTFDESIYIEYILSKSSYTKTDVNKIIYPKSVEAKISPFTNKALNNYLYNQVKSKVEIRQDKVLLDYFNQKQVELEENLGMIFSSNTSKYLKENSSNLDAELLLNDFLESSEDYHNYESLNRFIYTNVFNSTYIKNNKGEAKLTLNDSQKKMVIQQFEESLTDKEKLSLEEVEDLYIVNSIEDLDGILPYESKAMDMLKENLKDKMFFHKGKMAFFKYGNLFPSINKDFIDSKFKGKTGNYKTILLYNNLNNSLNLNKENLKSPKLDNEKEPTIEQTEEKEYRFSVNKMLLVEKYETESHYFVRIPNTDAKEYFYIPKDECNWQGDVFYTTLKPDRKYKIYNSKAEFIEDKTFSQLKTNWDNKSKNTTLNNSIEKMEFKASSEMKEPSCKVYSSRIYLETEKGFYIKTSDPTVLLFAIKKICNWNEDKSYLVVTPKRNMWSNTGISKYKLTGFKKEFEKKLSFKEIDKYIKIFYPFSYKNKSNISLVVQKKDCDYVSNFIRIPCIINNIEGYIDVNNIKVKENHDKKSLNINLSDNEMLSFHNNDNKYINHFKASTIVDGYKNFKVKFLEKEEEKEVA